MTEIPDPIHSISNMIDMHHLNNQEEERPHFGCSQLGDECERRMWLNFRWALRQNFSGRILRLFRRGKREEDIVFEDLRAIGIEVDNSQEWVDFGSHVSGSCDGVVSNVPNKGKKVAVLEIKTHNEKSFGSFQKMTLQKAHPKHYIQMQTYMLGLGIDRGLYFAINKNNDEIYTEWVEFDRKVAEEAVTRGKRIALSDRMPEPISHDPSWYQCKMCSFHQFCHETKIAEKVNCRTCAHSTPKEDGTWRCERFDFEPIPLDKQRTGCDCHVIHPDLMPYPLDTERSTEHVATYVIDGEYLQNGEADANVFGSQEIIEYGIETLMNPIVDEARKLFDSTVSKVTKGF